MNKLLASSQDPKQLSLTVKGSLMLIVPIAGSIIKYAGGEVSNEDLNIIVEGVGDAVMFIGSLSSAFVLIYGTLRKIYNSFK